MHIISNAITTSVKIISATLLLLASFTLSAQGETSDSPTTENKTSPIEERLPLRELRVFTQVFEQVRRGYVEEVTDTELLENAIAGLLLELDPHSVYLNESDYDDLQESATGEYGGLGLEVGSEQGMIKIISPIDNTPAARAGIKAGDLIVEVDGTPVRGMALQKAIDKLRGEKGTSIDLVVLRENQESPIEFTIVRDTIQLSSVRSRMLEPGYGYVRVSQFQTSSGDEFKQALADLKDEEPDLKGVIIDLRNNPGGLVPASVDISDALLDGGTIVYTEGRLPSANSRYEASDGDMLEDIPVVVLINGGSASASEIVAGALQDHRRAAIIGTQSFGKGSVQTVIPLGDGRAVKLTTARYFTPSGRSIQAEGIVPDIIVEPAEIRRYALQDRVREEDLDGHLEANLEQSGDSGNKEEAVTEDHTDDNQLYEALNVLKGYQLLGRKTGSP